MAYNPNNPNGQATEANSAPVTIASNQSAVPVSGTFWQTTQPVSAASLPLPSNAAQETGGNLATTATNTTGLNNVVGTAGSSLPTKGVVVQGSDGSNARALHTDSSGNLDVNVQGTVPVSGTFWQTTQPVSGTVTTSPPSNASTNISQVGGSSVALGATTSSASIPVVTATNDANLSGFASSSGGGYIRQDSNVTIAKENGGNLATIVANQTNATQQAKVTDGTNIANVVAGDTGYNGISTAASSKTLSFSATTTGVILANTDARGFNTIEMVFTSVGTGLGITGQFSSNSGGTYTSMPNAYWFNTQNNTPGLYSAINVINFSSLPAPFIQFNITALSSGTVSGYVILSNKTSAPYQTVVGAQSGATVPGTAFYQGVQGRTSLPTAVSSGQLVGAYGDKFGRVVTIPQTTRDLVGQQSTTLTSTTSATTCVTAGAAGVFNDITSITFANSSATATLMTLSDGTNSYTFYVPAGDTRGATYQVPLAATTAATAWTAQCGTSVASVYVTVTYIKNQ